MEQLICYIAVYIAEAFIAWLYCDYLFSRKIPISQIAISFFAGYTLLFLFSAFNNIVINTILFTVINFLLMIRGYECAVKTAVLHAAFLSFLVAISEVSMALLLSIFVHDFTAYQYNISVMVTVSFLSKMLYLFLSLIGSRVFSPHKLNKTEPQLMCLFCGLPLISTVLSVFVMHIGLTSELTKPAELLIVINVISLLFINLVFLVLYNLLQKSSADQLSLQLSLQKERADVEYYQAIKEQYENQRIFVHDMKNHLRTIEGLAKVNGDAEIVDYVLNLESSLEQTKYIRYCKDPILNIILVRFTNICKEKGIVFYHDIRSDCNWNIDAPSITTLFSNLLSNAIEAAERSSEQTIEFSIVDSFTQKVSVITVVNSCTTQPLLDSSGQFITTKHDKNLHGIGLKSINRIIRKYNGISTMYYDSNAKRFHHIIQIAYKDL